MQSRGQKKQSGAQKEKRGKFHLGSGRILMFSFLLAILVGTGILMLPVSSAVGEQTDVVTALFTATTSVCVTGLVVVDTYMHWSLFGKVVILFLIQLGGLGIMTVSSMLMLLAKKKFSMRDRILLYDAFNMDTHSGILSFLVAVFKGTFAVEGVGAILYSFILVPQYGPKGIWYSIFTSISAFCNAGIDIFGPDSLCAYRSDPAMLTVTMLLVVLGGLGYVVWFDLYTSLKSGIGHGFSFSRMAGRLREHTKLVLMLTAVLLFGGALFILILEYHNPDTIGAMGFGDKLLNSIFESVTLRTAGFVAIPQQNFSRATCILAYFLMFIGGSPVGTAGGVKTVTMFIVILNAVSFVRNRTETVVFSRRISEDMMRKAAAIIAVSFGAVLAFETLLLATNDVAMEDGLFEVVSALATVGLTRGLTPNLNTAGKLIIITCMYLGRIGPISMALFFTKVKPSKNSISFAEGRFYVG